MLDEDHAELAARHEDAFSRELLTEFLCRPDDVLRRHKLAAHGRGNLGVVLLDVADAVEAADGVARVDNARDIVCAAVVDEQGLKPFGDRAGAVVAEDDALNGRQDGLDVGAQLRLDGRGHRRLALPVDAHDLLADRRAAARDDARLGDGRPRNVGDKAAYIRAIRGEDLAQPVGALVSADEADGVDLAAEGRDVVDDIGRAARDDFLARLLEHEHGSFARDARDAAVEVDVGDHVADDEDAPALHAGQGIMVFLLQRIHPFSCLPALHQIGRKRHLTFQVLSRPS